MWLLWIFLGALLYGLTALAAGVVLDWFWDNRRRGSLPEDYDDWENDGGH